MKRSKNSFFLILLTSILVLGGQLLEGKIGALFTLSIAALMNFLSYWHSDRLVLKMCGATEISDVKNRPRQTNPSTVNLFIVNPIRRDFLSSLPSTHPPTEEKTERLHQIAAKMGIF